MQSRLGILMDNFGITGKDLSNLLHIDSSLVSKWRSGKRNLKPNSVYTNQIIKHIMNLDRTNQYAKIRLILSSDYLNMFKATENEISLFLKDWLTTTAAETEGPISASDELQNLKNATNMSVYSLSGNTGRRQAMQFLLKYAQHISPGAELWFYSTEPAEWEAESPSYFEEWRTRTLSILGESGTIKLIHSLDGSYELLAQNILKWIPMHMTGNTKAYFIPKYKNESLQYTYYLIKDHLAIYNWSLRNTSGRELNTYITHEPQIVHDIENMLDSYFNTSTEIFTRKYYTHGDENIDYLLQNIESGARQYQSGEIFPPFNLSEKTMREVLRTNGYFGKELEELIEKLAVIADLGMHTPRRLFIQPEKLSKQLSQEAVVINELSFFCGRTISIPHKMYLRIIEEGIDIINSLPYVHVCYASLPFLQYLGNIEILAKENTSISFSSTIIEQPMTLITNEMTTVTAVYNFFDELWSSVPYICRNKEYVAKQVHKQLDAAKLADIENEK